jgi:hypothetical protein
MSTTTLIRQALTVAGYDHNAPTEANLIECYLDYATSYNGNIEDIREDIKDGLITISQMCRSLIRSN